MPFSIILVFLGFIDVYNAQWYIYNSYLTSDEIYTINTGTLGYLYSSSFALTSTSTQAQFITCTTPATSYITLNSTKPSVQYYYANTMQSGSYITFDLLFQGTWLNMSVTFTIGTFSYSYTYNSPTVYPITSGFCNNLSADVRTINYSLTTTTSSKFQFTSTGSGDAQVSIKNIYVFTPQCYPQCSSCTGPNFNQCTGCYYGSPTNNICPPCISNQYYVKQQGCKDICDIYSPIYYNGFCQNYQITSIISSYIQSNPLYPENLKWSILYDSQNIDTSPGPFYANQYIYGVFKFKSGIYRFFDLQSTYSYASYLIGLRISISTLNDIPLNCGIQFKINDTYYGSIYRNASGIQTHKLKIYSANNFGGYLTYSTSQRYELITYLDIPASPILFTVVGNYTDNTAGWGIGSITFTTGYCPSYCQLCEVSFKCKTCASGYYNYRDGSCINSCSSQYQKLNGNYCYDYDDETPYSKYLIQEFVSGFNPQQYAQYTLVSQNGTNFLKGSDIYYSTWQSMRVFGGPFIWAQAKFQRIYNIIDPHHSITIAFYILYGPLFPSDGSFIYTIENNTPVSKSTTSYYSQYTDGSKYDKVYQRITHNTSTLTITWECFGPNNEPIKAYCGFYNYYIAVHQCQPYCLSCLDQNTCTQWNSTYDSSIVKFSQSECLSDQYFDRDSFRCLQCILPCLTCTSKIDCQTCQSTYTQTRKGCVCLMNQYEDQNQCFNCPIECNQCLSSTYCFECLFTNNRQLVNGQCKCIDGYYPIALNPKCQQCHSFCKTCIGPTSDECLTCTNIINIEQVGQICRCPQGSYYQETIKTCSLCHSSCLTCFRTTINGCLTCNPSLNRILKGLKCECAPGYYELNNICTNCPITEDISLIQCYKQCNTNQQLWHTNICNSCDSEYQLVSGDCQPICGDLQIKGYEQCEDGNTTLDDLCYNCQFQCPLHCQICDQTTTLPCPDICGDGIVTGIEQCEDGNSIQYDGCFNCQYQCQQQCTKCIKGECIECATNGWYIDPTVTPWQCKERCGDNLLVGSEQCEDGNQIDTDGCKDCKYYCRIGCSSCNYSNKTCLSCEFPGFAPYSFYCKNICGDGLVVVDPNGFFSEQCDDGNTANDDGCSSTCQFQCQSISICTSCVSNRCELCATGYLLTLNKTCIPICGDGLLVTGEQCEDTSILPYKGCQNCKAKCQSSCLTCSTTGLGCNSCKIGYTRIDYLCYPICGDKIVTDDEQCDDGNLILGDGCHFCQYSCQDSCLNCIKGICYDCLDGYELIQSKCYPICGDGVILNVEQCEIQDQLQTYLNCKSCKLTCDINCVSCLCGICQQCIYGYELSLNQQKCQKSLQNTDFAIENCLIQIRNSCYKCQDYSYFDQVEQKCKLKEAPMTFCQYNLKLQPDIYCSQCFEYCSLCNDNTCVSCQTGYYLDENQQCNSFCGDGILSHDEQCEINDQNCLSCVLEAPKLCELQFQNLCYQCEYGYYYNQYSNICESKCGDGIVVHDEDCEDNNYLDFDGCYQCKYSCCQYCTNCIDGVCQECELGFFHYDGFCFNEEKDYECSFECKICQQGQCIQCQKEYKFNEYGDCVPGCQEGCINCNYSQCLQCGMQYYLSDNNCILIEQCSVGLYLNQEVLICESQCGDGYITGWEECDDQNSQQFDGCYTCKFECIENCIECIQGECLQCSTEFNLIENQCLSKCQETCLNCVQGVCQLCTSGYFLNEYYKCSKIDCEYDFSCLQECGNGILEAQEQCDDQNLINGDSCNNYCELTCDANCINCQDGICLQCAEGWIFNLFFCYPICGDSIVVGNEECDDGNSISFDGCFKCQFQCTKFCENCQQGVCQSCQINFELDQSNNQCKPIQNQVLTYTQPDCKLYNNDQCIQCQLGYLDWITNTCLISYNMNKCSKNCKYCLLEKCLECEQGYYGNQCTPKCGDGLIVKEEECDDGSSYQLDSCLNCKYSCPQYCKICAYGVCTHCYQGFYLDIVSNSCNSSCGDKIQANDEVCDDGNELRYDGCFECKYQCQQECLDCQFGKCNLCETPLVLVQSKGICEQLKQCEGLTGLYYDASQNDCLPQCGDGIIVGNEQCEDMNSIPYDGCYECKYQCDKLCINCQKGECFECEKGYQLDGQICKTKCGDGIKIGDELCDDNNDTPRDGCTLCKIDPQYKCQEDINLLSFCYNCQENCEDCKYDLNLVECLQCKKGYFLKDNTCNSCSAKCEECVNTPNNCTVCSTGDCKKCDNISGFYLNQESKSCITKCGDNIIAGLEQCDDGNLIDKDGCNTKCLIEKEFVCQGGVCFVPPKKQIELTYSNSTTTSDFDLIFEDLELDGVCDKLNIWIEEFKKNEFQFITSKKNNSTTQGYGGCEIKFNFFKTIQESNLIHLIVPLQENKTRILEETREIIITPRRLVYYNEDQQAQAQTVASASSSLTFILQLVGPLTIILGGFNFFWTILDILTWINNFYFLNVDYPLNVKLFFNQLQWGDIINIPDIISLNSPDDPYYFEAPPKFLEKDVNPLFLNNIQLFCGLILLAILAYFCSICIVQIIENKYQPNFVSTHKIEIFSVSQVNKSIEVISPQKSSTKTFKFKTKDMPYLINTVYKEVLWFKENFRAKLLQIIGLVFLDICLACVLQLQYTKNQEFIIIQMNILLAIIGVIFIVSVFQLYSYVCSQHQVLYESQIFQNYYSSLYEGINTKQLLARKYCYVNLLRKALFIFFTVYFYNVPLLQTSLCCLTCFLNLALILYQNPFENRSVLIQTAIPDCCIFIIIFITVLLAIHDVSNIFSFDQKYMTGWIILFFIGFSIFVQLIFLFQQFFKDMKQRLIQLKDMICKQKSKKN